MTAPDELVDLVRERRLIPFVGAGFSSSLGLPDWQTLLHHIANTVEDSLPFEEILEQTHGDLLQVAEYLFLKCDSHIGPIRHAVEQRMRDNIDPSTSGLHVELVNLGAPQIYTTNYDDLIELTFRELGLPVTAVVLPRDVALSTDNKKTQVVKYHGDLRHEDTLVLTESAYYRRLDFESPMDLKFRSDLLGRSVLFMGYSFRDINIRIIWFKLMEMMKDIPEADRMPSFIVRTDESPVMDDLYASVGLKSIQLRPRSASNSGEEASNPTELLGAFLSDLATRAAGRSGTIPGQARKTFISAAYIAHYRQLVENRGVRFRIASTGGRLLSSSSVLTPNLTDRLSINPVPESLQETVRTLALRAISETYGILNLDAVLRFAKSYEISSEFTRYFVRVLSNATGSRPIRQQLILSNDLEWRKIWSFKLDEAAARRPLENLADEIEFHESGERDEDLAYCVDIGMRIANGTLLDAPAANPTRRKAKKLIQQAALMYPAIREYIPAADGPPKLAPILKQFARQTRRRTSAKRS